jgi:hypothetical protein
MSFAKLAVLTTLVAVPLFGCGSSAKPVAGTGLPNSHALGRGRVDDPRTNKPNHVECLRQAKLPVTEVGQTALRIGSAPGGPTVQFLPTPGAAQAAMIQGERQAQGAEVIGSALLYPNKASDRILKAVEDCLAHGVAG